MNSYGDADVLCPFFISSDDVSIKCEGLEANMVTKHVFRTDKGNFLRDKKNEYMDRFCKCDYKECMMCQMLTKKYE